MPHTVRQSRPPIYYFWEGIVSGRSPMGILLLSSLMVSVWACPAPAEKNWAGICHSPEVFIFHEQYWLYLRQLKWTSPASKLPSLGTACPTLVWFAQWKCVIVKAFTLFCSLCGADWKNKWDFQRKIIWAHFFCSYLQGCWLLSTIGEQTETVGWAKYLWQVLAMSDYWALELWLVRLEECCMYKTHTGFPRHSMKKEGEYETSHFIFILTICKNGNILSILC